MFWNKKKKKEEEIPVDMVFTDQTLFDGSSMFPPIQKNEDGTYSISLSDFESITEPKLVTDRLYVISRGNIDLEEAQNITIHASMAHPEFAEYLLTEKHVDLVWCSAYPDSLFGGMELKDLLIGYVQQSEGDQYLKDDSQLIPIEGTKDGDDYYILILVHMEF